MHFVVFDLETRNSFQDVGGRQNLHLLGISVAVVWDSRTNEFAVYREPAMDTLVDHLRSAPCVVGFNLIHFDYPVLQPYTTFSLQTLPTLDMLDHLYRKLGFRVSLNNLARTTLKVKKSADGLQAIHWYRSGDWQKLIKYCQEDVRITRDLYLFGKQNGYLLFWDGKYRIERKVPVSWT